MTTEAALLDAIYERPEDDAARWVYTDYLLERGDPRGEFMVLQMLRLTRELSRDEARIERMLCRAHARTWVPSELARKTQSLLWRFERGFVARCKLRPSQQRIGAPPVDHPGWRTVHTITADGDGFGANRQLLLPALANLRRLELSTGGFVRDYLSDPAPRTLETLAFSYTFRGVPDAEIVRLLCANPALASLQHLIVWFQSVDVLAELASSELVARLERLSLWDGRTWPRVPEALRARVRNVDFDGWRLQRELFR